jgi:hypothetical protein
MCTTQELQRRGLSQGAIRWRVKKGLLSKIIRGVYGDGPARPSPLDKAVAVVVATRGVASGTLAGTLTCLDGVKLRGADVTVGSGRSAQRQGARQRDLAAERVILVEGVRCTDGLQTLVDLASEVDDLVWEQALECALRRRLTTIDAVQRAAQGPQRGAARMRRVLAQRPTGSPPTESLLETLMVQLARTIPALPPPERQVEVRDPDGALRARVDLAWPELGLFVELDGQHHVGQPVRDARRETIVVALTGWLCGRFTWDDLRRRPSTTRGRLTALAGQARRRPVA